MGFCFLLVASSEGRNEYIHPNSLNPEVQNVFPTAPYILQC